MVLGAIRCISVGTVSTSTNSTSTIVLFSFQAEGSVDDDVLNSFCWMYSSFDMPGQFSGPCFRRKHVSAHLYNTYYQWVPIFLAIQAGLFYIPRCLWLLIEGGLMSYIVKGMLS